MSVEEMLNRLRSNAGQWHQQAKLLPLLLRAGCDSVAVEEAVGLERRVQNVWVAAEQVWLERAARKIALTQGSSLWGCTVGRIAVWVAILFLLLVLLAPVCTLLG